MCKNMNFLQMKPELIFLGCSALFEPESIAFLNGIMVIKKPRNSYAARFFYLKRYAFKPEKCLVPAAATK